MSYQIYPLTEAEARQILNWRYAAPYDYYDPPVPDNVDAIVRQFLDPENGFHGVRDQAHRFTGFCSYGADGQVPGWHYSEGPLDLGLGMKPDNTNQGRGRGFFEAIINYGSRVFEPPSLRLTVARFNRRAIKVYESAGFKVTAEFLEIPSTEPHLVMERPPIS